MTNRSHLLLGVGSLALGALVLSACSKRTAPRPAPRVEPAAAPSAPPAPPRFLAAPVASAMIDLPPVADPSPARVGRGRARGSIVDAFAVDDDGAVFVLDDEAGELVVQPEGDPKRARVLARVGRPAPTDIVSDARLYERLFDVAVDATTVYFTSDVRTFDGSRCAYALRAVPKTGGPSRVLWRGEIRGGVASRVVADEGSLYVLRDEDRREAGATPAAIVRVPKSGGAERVVAADLHGFWPFAIHEGDLWVQTGRDGGAIARLPKGGGAASPAARVADAIGAIVVGDRFLYYSERELARRDMALRRIALHGGEPELVARFDGFPGGVAYDEGAVYWAEETPGVDATLPPLRIVRRDDSMAPPRVVATEIPRGGYWTVRRHVAYWGTPGGVASKKVARAER